MVWYLEEIPLSFADIPTLKRIDLMRCSSRESLVASALRIKEEVKEIEGCDRIHLNIYGCFWQWFVKHVLVATTWQLQQKHRQSGRMEFFLSKLL
uniref:Uncharacterized protein LOC104226952 isoform X3 n=1 Tax=Nicotiana sylvestris TaxID=4096 RepID=A0A1U7WRQ5_NICSY|nr:PREDICTED: uncharacterized protein LOC104226952 isoform X3 [Nicotiana sylvestris]